MAKSSGKRPAACPECEGPLDKGAVLCVNCGFHLEKGERLTTVARRVERCWDSGWPLTARLIVFGLVACGLVALAFVPLPKDMSPHLRWLLVPVGLLAALLVGTLTRIKLTKNAKGQPLLILARWIAFIPSGGSTLALRKFAVVKTCYGMKFDSAGFFFTILTLLSGELVVYRTDGYDDETFGLVLAAEGGRREVTIYRGRDTGKGEEIAGAIEEAAGLEVEVVRM